MQGVQWWVGWHTQQPFRGPGYMQEAYYVDRNPTTSPSGSDLTPVGHYHVTYDRQGTRPPAPTRISS